MKRSPRLNLADQFAAILAALPSGLVSVESRAKAIASLKDQQEWKGDGFLRCVRVFVLRVSNGVSGYDKLFVVVFSKGFSGGSR